MKKVLVLMLSFMLFSFLTCLQGQSQEPLYSVPNPIIYGVAPNGNLIWYSHPGFNTGADIPAGKTIGFGGWQNYKSVFANGNIIYGITHDGNLNWYKYAAYQNGNAEVVGAKTVGFGGWQQFKSVFGGGNGVIYAIGYDGKLFWYKYADEQNGNQEVVGGKVIGTGWQQFKFVFSAGNGIIYAVGTDGSLYWYKHLGVENGEEKWEGGGHHLIETGGWQNYKFMFSGGNGIIYAVGYDGNLYWYKHEGHQNGAATLTVNARRKIGTGGWSNFVNIFSAPMPNIKVQSAQTGLGVTQQGLAGLQSSLWTTKSIPVCWENPSNTNATERGWVQNSIRNTWERHSDFRFTGWGTCNDNSSGIRIFIADAWPKVIALGKELDGKKNGMVLNFDWGGCVDPNDPGSRRYCAEVIAAHEFGHALGFSHEHNRDDCKCDDPPQGTDGDFYATPCDINSIMNYCNPAYNNNGQLSTYDIIGLHVMYDEGATGLEHFYTISDSERANAISQYKFLDEGINGYVYGTPVGNTKKFYRLVSTSAANPGDHLYTIYESERDEAITKYGYQLEGVACYVFENQEDKTLPLYRLRSIKKGFHFYTMSELERDAAVAKYGFTYEGISCYIYGFQQANTLPFYRLLR